MLVDVTEEQIREQLDRILHSAQFKSSRRCRSFLEYVVNQASSGQLDHLKERTIGIEVFGRDPDYDTNHDPVVRGTASEIRKRLAQYYQAAGNAGELRIDLAAGSYLPDFHIPVPTPATQPSETRAVSVPLTVEVERSVRPETALVATSRRSPRWFIAVTLAALIGVVLLATLLLKKESSGQAGIADEFWAPVLNSKGPVLLCVGQPTVFNVLGSLNTELLQPGTKHAGGKVPIDLSLIVPNSDRYLALGDAMCLSALTAFLARHDREYHVRGGGSTSFADLRENTTVLIGGFTNDWTMRLTKQLRFTFHRDDATDTIYVDDRLNPGKRVWQLTGIWPEWKMPVDYALVTRVLDPNTGKIVISAAGITQYGTAAAGEFLTDPKNLAQALKQAPKDWQQRSMEVVLETRVIGGTAGPPQVVATHFQ